MNNAYQQHNKNYLQVELQDKVSTASPHELINMLFQGAKMEMKSAIIAMKHQKVDLQVKHISKAYDIVEGLRTSVEVDKGGTISSNLIKVYEFVLHTLIKANLEDSSQKLEECYKQINELADAWSAIKPANEAQIT